jgi:hypothetical protein
MTELLRKAFAEAVRLPDADQEGLAAWILKKPNPNRLW